MICQVIDGIFDQLYIHQVDSLIRDIPLSTNNIANRKTWPYGNEGSHRLLGQILFDRSSINNIKTLKPETETFFKMFEVIEDKLKAYFYLSQISLNVQHSGCDGTTHCDSPDSYDHTILLMTNSIWEKEWGGQFQLIENDKVIEEHEYVPGRVIL